MTQKLVEHEVQKKTPENSRRKSGEHENKFETPLIAMQIGGWDEMCGMAEEGVFNE